MPTTLDQEREYDDIMNIVYTLLFLLGLVTFVSCCVYCINKKEKNEIKYERSNIDVI